MLRFLLSAVSICLLLAATFFSPGLVNARRCEVKLPVTLLSLYRTSDFIYIGRFDRREEGEAVESPQNYREVPVKNHFSITSTLKGEPRKMVVLEDTDYIFTAIQKSGPASGVEAEQADNETVGQSGESAEKAGSEESVDVPDEEFAADDDDELKAGDPVILFLNREGDDDSEDGDVSLSDYQDGLKKLTADGIVSYEARIRELNGIFENGKPKYSDLVAWLVRCAEDPNTRWEGTYELLRSFQMKEWQDEHPEEAKENAKAVPAPDGEELERISLRVPKDFETGDPGFAGALTEGQKLILTDTLMRRSAKTFGFGDRELVDLVSKWGDTKVAGNLLDQLRSQSSDTDVATDLMTSIAQIFNDEELTSTSSRYASTRWESAEDQVDAEYLEEPEQTDADEQPEAVSETVVDVNAALEPEPATTEEVANVDTTDADEQKATVEEAPKVKKTYEQFRRELILKFLDRADKLLAKEKRPTPDN